MIFNSSLKKPIAVNKQRSIANVRPATPLLRCPPVRNAAVPAPAPAPQKGSDAPADAKIVGNVLPIPNTTITKADAPKVEAGEGEDLLFLKATLDKAVAAQKIYSKFDQAQVDKIFKAAAFAANAARMPLAKMAAEETRMGVYEDKVIKNHFASEFIYNKYKNTKTCGVVEVDEAGGMTKIAEPVGVVAGIVPTTNPTSTAIFKALLCLKTRNALVLCPHPRARAATIAAAKIVHDAAVEAGAPPGIIAWIEHPSSTISQALMQAPAVSLILATGGPGMVKAAYSSGHPSVGVGAGNTPAVIDETADIDMAVSSILLSKTFDNGVICASEQSVIVVDSVYDKVRAEFVRRGAHFFTEAEKIKAREKIQVDGKLNPNIVGQSVAQLAELFGISSTVPAGTRVLIGEAKEIGHHEALSIEKLCPILAFYRASDYAEAVTMADKLIRFGGPGHTSVLYTNPMNKANIDLFSGTVNTARILINCPASQGAIGDIYNFHLDPSLTLGCGTWGSTSVSTNVGPTQLLNFKSVTERRNNMLWFRVPPKIFFRPGCLEVALKDLAGKKRALIVTDQPLMEMGYADKVTKILDTINVHHQLFYHVEPDPTIACIEEGLREAHSFKPDVIIALGGGSPMDAAKVMWLMYENPDIKFEGLSLRFMDIRKRVYDIQENKSFKSQLVCIPTTSGTGSEVTPFSVVTDSEIHQKFPLADYVLTPSMAIIDPQLVMAMPKKLTSYGGIDALTHALESYVSILATDYTKGLSREATLMIFKYLPIAYKNPNDVVAREKVHNAATIAGMAFGNAFLGICHSMAHKLGAEYHIPHGLANGALISHVVRYNATDRPFKQSAFPQYESPRAKADYAALADALGLGGSTQEEKVILLINAIEDLKKQIDIPSTIREIIQNERGVVKVSDKEYEARLEKLGESAFDDQCTGSNPRFPLIPDLRRIMLDAYNAPITPLKNLVF